MRLLARLAQDDQLEWIAKLIVNGEIDRARAIVARYEAAEAPCTCTHTAHERMESATCKRHAPGLVRR